MLLFLSRQLKTLLNCWELVQNAMNCLTHSTQGDEWPYHLPCWWGHSEARVPLYAAEPSGWEDSSHCTSQPPHAESTGCQESNQTGKQSRSIQTLSWSVISWNQPPSVSANISQQGSPQSPLWEPANAHQCSAKHNQLQATSLSWQIEETTSVLGGGGGHPRACSAGRTLLSSNSNN